MQVESAAKWRVPPLDLSAVSVLSNETDRRWMNGHHHHHHHLSHHHHQQQQQHLHTTGGGSNGQTPPPPPPSKKIQYGADGLPIDPRDWTRANVWTWLINLAQSEGLDISPELAQKFPMNGKALCLMSLDMYLTRVPVGGKMLYRDFRVRLARAMSL
ncbi:nuclear receptor subfamily 4 group A member 3 [Wyeomyia smithii]|uniref:nuclear receptor subfamily 4 group A member 3 n=1 Tax=Wyeomyia smithii TaxID=174621 RepID=UPI002467E7B0|nr:nuclear receptor subfamily 4 group A member 3 [Wyeomyia smithii]